MSDDVTSQIAQLEQAAHRLVEQGRYPEALPLVERACQIATKQLGSDHPVLARCLNELGLIHQRLRDYAHAETEFAESLRIRVAAFGEIHSSVAQSLNNLGRLYEALKQHAKAEPLLLQACEVLESSVGETDGRFIRCLNNLANFYVDIGDSARAERTLHRILQLRRITQREAHPDVAATLEQLVSLYWSTGDYAAAETNLHRLIAIWRSIKGDVDPSVASALNRLALLYYQLGRYSEAEPLYRKALDIYDETIGDEDKETAIALDNLAMLYSETGRYAEAEPLYLRAQRIWSATVGEEHPEFATNQLNLGYLYAVTGRHGEAEAAYKRALEIGRRVFGDRHESVARALNNLALLYYDLDRLNEAEQLLKEALEIYEATLRETHTDLATCRNSLAELYRARGQYDAAEPLYLQAIKAYRTEFGNNHPLVIRSMEGLGELYSAISNRLAATQIFERILEARRAVLGEKDIAVAADLDRLARLDLDAGVADEAVTLLQEALEIRRETFGEEDRRTVVSLYNLATAYVAANRGSEALPLLVEFATQDERTAIRALASRSADERTTYLRRLRERLYEFLSLVAQQLPDSNEAVRAALDLVLRRKGISTEPLAVLRNFVIDGQYPAIEPSFRRLLALRSQVGAKTLQVPSRSDTVALAAYFQELEVLTTQRDQLEMELIQAIPEAEILDGLRAANCESVARALPPGAVLVEFVRCVCWQLIGSSASENGGRPRTRYLALVIAAGDPKHVCLIDLDDAARIEELVSQFRTSITGRIDPRSGFDEDSTMRDVPAPSAQAVDQGAALRERLFDPLRPFLGNHTRLFLCPDGDLYRLPFQVLPTTDGGRLIDHFSITYLTAGREVLRLGSHAHLGGRPKRVRAIVLADPDFDASAAPSAHSAEMQCSESINNAPGSLRFSPLPGARDEGVEVATRLNVKPFLGPEAVISELTGSPSPTILHLATHGYFLPERPMAVDLDDLDLYEHTVNLRGSGVLGEGLGRLSGLLVQDPLLRSGLAFAGANTWLEGGEPPAGADDGLLTAQDVAGMDLNGTELVVLSACATGLGEVSIGDGVYGLRRSFELAGAATLVMSLWKVPDQQTKELMIDFYDRILNGEARDEALREAQRALKKKYPDPLFWGAFICQGDTAPLYFDAERAARLTADRQGGPGRPGGSK